MRMIGKQKVELRTYKKKEKKERKEQQQECILSLQLRNRKYSTIYLLVYFRC